MRDDVIIKAQYLSDINLEDSFFDSLKADYAGFEDWFNKKSQNKEWVFVSYDGDALQGFCI